MCVHTVRVIYAECFKNMCMHLCIANNISYVRMIERFTYICIHIRMTIMHKTLLVGVVINQMHDICYSTTFSGQPW